MDQNMLVRFAEDFIRVVDRLTQWKYAAWLLPLMAVACSLFTAFPSSDLANSQEMSENWGALLEQVQDPFSVKDHPSASHAANMAFRITPVLLAKALGLRSINAFLILQGVALVLLFFVLPRLFRKISNDPVVSWLLTFSVSFMFVGNVLCSDYRGFFEVLAFLFLAGTLLFDSLFLILGCSLLAFFTDERALIASGLVYIFFVVEREKDVNALGLASFFRFSPKMIVLMASWVVYFSLRFFLSYRFGLKTNATGLVDYLLHTTIKQINIFPFALWTGLEGFWVIVLIAFAHLVTARKWSFVALCSVAFGVVVLTAIWVFDITRSMAYLMPLIFISLAIVSRLQPLKNLRVISVVVLVFSFFPTYYAAGVDHIGWLYPMPLQLLRMMAM